ncbi:uncharacterized protein LOC131984152 isoform X2 [Centropristis striata]|uniref:uncharacterized protein LOC131984152 isoform X2 n=1 Tax=Centropristis striata TaxID=184440 RepID=UPI0027E1E982|nr:uncharacterized protein LOC131984152 isoform X2 [Centropristis striata]
MFSHCFTFPFLKQEDRNDEMKIEVTSASAKFSISRSIRYTSMSLLSVVEQAIKSCKAEQAKINDNIQLYREILQSLTPHPKTDLDESECADAVITATCLHAATFTDTDTSPREKEDMELLERALDKALRVRTGTESSKNRQTAPGKGPGTTAVTSKTATQASEASKGNTATARLTSKSAGLEKKEHKKSGGIVHHQSTRKSQQAVSASGSLDRGQVHKTMRSKVLSGNDPSKAAAIPSPSNISDKQESGAHSLPQHSGKASDQTAEWKSLRSKKNRLWDKVVDLQRKPVPGRSHFMERMRATFPEDWPCGCPDQTRDLINRLTHRGRDLIRQWQTQEFLAKQAPEVASEMGGYSKSDSSLTLERLQKSAAHLHEVAHQVKQEWEAWDRWRPEGGCLCPTGADGVWGDGMVAPLPPTITYRTEAELREFEQLRTRLALLQQETSIEQALLDTLSPQLSSIEPGPGCPDVTVLRHMYSLLGEGGQRFPAVVLDSETD